MTLERRVLLAGASAIALGCTRSGAAPLIVFGAASMREVIDAASLQWSRGARVEVRATFDATPRLARLVIEGAACDVFVSADEAWMDDLEKRGELAAGTRRDLATTELVAIVPAGSGAGVEAARDLLSVKRLALAGEHVPAGRYARAALRASGVLAALEPKIVAADSVRAALEWVARGEADAGVVYASDPRIEPRVRVAFTFANETHPPIRYPGAVLRRAKRPREGAAWLDVFAGAEGEAILERAGFRGLP